jgi:hypothetical protein
MTESVSSAENNSPKNRSSYVWASCSDAGWEALIPASNFHLPVPKVPSVILSKPDESLPVNPKRSPVGSISRGAAHRGRSKSIQKRKSSPDASASPRARDPLSPSSVWAASLRDELDEKPCRQGEAERNFIELNRRRLTEPSRPTKVSLLAQASKQLEESELISTSLAERLKQLHAKLNV